MEADNYEVFTIVTFESKRPMYGDTDVANLNKNTETLTFNNLP